MLRSDFGSALMSGAQKSGALELVGNPIWTIISYSCEGNKKSRDGIGKLRIAPHVVQEKTTNCQWLKKVRYFP